MLGEQRRDEKLFYAVRMEEFVPKDHLLRQIDEIADLGFIKKKVKHLYSHTGRPSVDPEVLIRMLLVGYLYGISSERRLCEDVRMHIGYRWFVGLSLEDKVPNHSTFSKNRHERFSESGLFQEIFDEIVRQCIEKGLVHGAHLTVDSTNLAANASIKSMEPIVVEMKPQEYIDKLEAESASEEKPWEPWDDFPHRGQKLSNKTHRSKTDPDARFSKKSSGGSTYLGYSATYVMDNKSRVIVGAEAGKPDKRSDCDAAFALLLRLKWCHKLRPKTLGADKGYSSGTFLHALLEEKITPHIPVARYGSHSTKGIYSIEAFTFDPTDNTFLCPAGNRLRYWGIHKISRQHVYRASVHDCRDCAQKEQCTKDRARSVSFHIYKESIDKVKALNRTEVYRVSQRIRKRIEELFGEAKECMGFRRAKFRRTKWVQEQVLMTATAQNIKRMVKYRANRGPKTEAIEAHKVKDYSSKSLWVNILNLLLFTQEPCIRREVCWV